MSVNQVHLEWHLHLARRLRLSEKREVALRVASKRHDADPVLLRAVLMTEMLARPAPHRLLEFAAFTLLCLLAPRRASRMTLGPAQIRVSTDQTLGGRALLMAGLRLMFWRRACEAAAQTLSGFGGSDSDAACRRYNGPVCSENYKELVKGLAMSSRG